MISEKEKKDIEPSVLYVVPTPVGNLDDITLRALKILKAADIIACEDTRHSGNLLKLLGILPKKLESIHEHNEESKSEYLITLLKSGNSIALVSDAGTPSISDPGFRFIRKAIANEIKIVPLPGATALIPALVASGFNTENFYFGGFPPHKKGRQKFFNAISLLDCTIVLYESPYRITNILEDIEKYFGIDRKICIAREISKVFEEFNRGTIIELKARYNDSAKIKGEFVIIINEKTISTKL